MTWADHEVEWLRDAFSRGLSGTAAAQESSSRIGRSLTRQAVIGKWNRLGLKRPDMGHGPRVTSRPLSPGNIDDPNHEPRGCRYIFGGVGEPEGWAYCQEPQKQGSSYCPEHYAICVVGTLDDAKRDALLSVTKGPNNERTIHHQGGS